MEEYPEEEKQLANAALKRRKEFVAGRRCARNALEEIGLAPCSLPSDENRVPRWPEGVIGSISRSSGSLVNNARVNQVRMCVPL